MSDGTEGLALDAKMAILADGFPTLQLQVLQYLLEASENDLDRAVQLALEEAASDPAAAPSSGGSSGSAPAKASPEFLQLHTMFPDHAHAELHHALLCCKNDVSMAIDVLLGISPMPSPPGAATSSRAPSFLDVRLVYCVPDSPLTEGHADYER